MIRRTVTRATALTALFALSSACSNSTSPRSDVVDVQDVLDASIAADAAQDIVDATPPRSIGRPCEGPATGMPEQGDCEDGQLCLPGEFGFPAGYCTAQCGATACPAGSACVVLGGSFRVCLATCRTASDCRVDEGYGCQPSPTGGPPLVCLPTDGPVGTRDGAGCYTTDGGAHPLPALERRTFNESNISLSRERTDARLSAEGNVVVSPVNGAVATSYIAVSNRSAFMGVSTRFADGTVQREGAVRDPERSTTSDPVLAYTPDGRLHMVFMGYNVSSQGQPTGMRIRFASSTNDGRTWDVARGVEPDGFCAGGCDKPWIVVGPTPPSLLTRDAGVPEDAGVELDAGVEPDAGVGPEAGSLSGLSIYVGFMVQLNRGQTVELHTVRSDDGGATWTRPMRLATSTGSSVAPNLLTPAVSADGTLHLVHAALTVAGGSTARFGDARNRVVYRSSRDGGATWSGPINVSRSGDTPVYGQPIVAVDGARLHVAYVIGNITGAWDILLATSSDEGRTWTHRRVNDEPDSCATHAFPWIVADPARGRVHATWLENRFGDGAAVYASCPSDPASPCGRNELVSDERFTMVTAREPGRWHGDYQGLALAPDGTLWAGWSDTRTGSPAMYLARGTVR